MVNNISNYDTIVVHGCSHLHGDFVIQGSKNESFEVLCACLLTSEKNIIHNVPDIIDVHNLLSMFKLFGVSIVQLAPYSYEIDTTTVSIDNINIESLRYYINRLRGGVLILGALLARCGMAILPIPGGDKIGRRRMDTHFLGIKQLNCSYRFDNDKNVYIATTKQLKGNYILLDESSVTGTANIILAAVLAEGQTTLYNAACEPHIQKLCQMLNNMGAQISGVGSNLLIINGVKKLHGCEFTISSDILEVGSIIAINAMTESDIKIINTNIDNEWLLPIVNRFRRLGLEININGNEVTMPIQEHYKISVDINPSSIVHVDDAIWPGFPTDLLSVFLVTATQAEGSILIHEKLYESRLFFVDNLIEMGAKIVLCDPHRAHVIGINKEYKLRATHLMSPDIRTGMSLLIAALAADGTSIIDKYSILQRGYQNIVERLNAVGANIEYA